MESQRVYAGTVENVIPIFTFFQTNVNAYKQQQARVQQPPPQSNSQAPAAKKGGAFDDLLSGFGNIGQKSAEKNRKMGDMKVRNLFTRG